MSRFDEIIRLFPVRNTKEEKAAFRKYALQTAEEMGFSVREIDNGGHKNIAIGDENKAKVIFTAHYDTPWASFFPNLMLPKNRGLHFAFQMAIVLPMLAAAFLAAYLVFEFVKLDYGVTANRLVPLAAYLVTYYGLFIAFMRGRRNRHNYNDNTSGVALVFDIMGKLDAEEKSKCAFLLFDNEERGKKGSKAFSKENKEIFEHTPIVNFDCVGFGDQFVAIEKERFKAHPMYEAFHAAFSSLENSHMLSSKNARANSDQTSFKLGNAVMTCALSKKGILYVNRIHTKKDTEVSKKNLNALSDAAHAFLKKI